MVRIQQIFFGNVFQQFFLDFQDIFSRRKAGAVAEAENVRVHRHRGFAKNGIENDIGSLASNAR